MEKLIKRKFILGLLVIFATLKVEAQIGYQLQAGYAMSKLGNPNLNGKFGGGFEVGYGVFAKYSERLEWTSNVTFISTKPKDNTCYYLTDPVWPNSGVYAKSLYTQSVNSFNIDYTMAYYIIPDILGIGGGLNLQMVFPGKLVTPDPYENYYISSENLEGKSSANDYPQIIPEVNFFLVGLEGALFVNPLERLQVYARYNFPLNNVYETYDDFGRVNLGTLRLGLALKIMPSVRDKRF